MSSLSTAGWNSRGTKTKFSALVMAIDTGDRGGVLRPGSMDHVVPTP